MLKKMKKIVSDRITIVTMLLVLLSFNGCKDVIVTDITKKEVTVISPADQLQSTNKNQLFWWNKVDQATQYNVQIVTPSFAAPDSIILDTILFVDKFYYSLDTANYQWRIRAENSEYKTDYKTFSLEIK